MIISKIVIRRAFPPKADPCLSARAAPLAESAWRIEYNNFSLCAIHYTLCFFLSALSIVGCVQTKAGCAQAKDYVGFHHGYLNVGMKQSFGQGGSKKNYYNVDKDTVITIGENKDDIIVDIGYPDKRERSLEGYEVWIYSEKKLKLFFDKKHLREWRNL
ncbi:MAG: hypothetical protein Q8O30_01160 [Candidatus Omnitrophota bacterium]|nr:hypothetical protein [Candidatus Omnitrophota bacterium]